MGLTKLDKKFNLKDKEQFLSLSFYDVYKVITKFRTLRLDLLNSSSRVDYVCGSKDGSEGGTRIPRQVDKESTLGPL